MAVDYSQGRYNVFKGRGPLAPLIGRIDEDEYVTSLSGELLYRVDGSEFYEVNGRYLGEITPTEDGLATVVDANHYCLFVIAPE
ncbi:hypothetical protein D3C79_791260 [compost metagenome]